MLLTKVKVALAGPVLAGTKFTPKRKLCPTARFIGYFTLVSQKTEPFLILFVIVIGVVPEFVIVTGRFK